jgi:hypothetical protein
VIGLPRVFSSTGLNRSQARTPLDVRVERAVGFRLSQDPRGGRCGRAATSRREPSTAPAGFINLDRSAHEQTGAQHARSHRGEQRRRMCCGHGVSISCLASKVLSPGPQWVRQLSAGETARCGGRQEKCRHRRPRCDLRHAGSPAVFGRLSLSLAVRAVFTPRREGMESNFLGGVCGHRSRRFDGTYDGSHGSR